MDNSQMSKDKIHYAIHSVDFRTDQTVNVDNDLSREDILKLAKRRPFNKFVTFPLKLEIMEYVELDPSVVINVEKTLEYINAPKLSIADIGPKPEPIKLYVEKDKLEEKPKETYISPFTGKVM